MKIEPNENLEIELTPQTDWETMFLLSEEGTSYKLIRIVDNEDEPKPKYVLTPNLK